MSSPATPRCSPCARSRSAAAHRVPGPRRGTRSAPSSAAACFGSTSMRSPRASTRFPDIVSATLRPLVPAHAARTAEVGARRAADPAGKRCELGRVVAGEGDAPPLVSASTRRCRGSGCRRPSRSKPARRCRRRRRAWPRRRSPRSSGAAIRGGVRTRHLAPGLADARPADAARRSGWATSATCV